MDRELEPALDEYLNSFVQATRGYSGWPLNVFLTPEGYPLVGGVYLPQEQFQTLLTRVTQAWQQDRETLEKAAADAAPITNHVRWPDPLPVGHHTRRHPGNGRVSEG
ncbi:MAG: DUF255 domain-containing protein [Gammaproteobacteria bacterium]|nr:DUF255 domain-containing protein [Gammaproteobacteria bacterium]MDX2461415.1 DUF255 domain-containing protein [Gammaproteobacteria bacterium]